MTDRLRQPAAQTRPQPSAANLVWAAVCFWAGGLPCTVWQVAYNAFYVAKEGYEHGVSGVVFGVPAISILMTPPAVGFLGAAVLSAKVARRNPGRLFGLSFLLGVAYYCVFWSCGGFEAAGTLAFGLWFGFPLVGGLVVLWAAYFVGLLGRP